MLSSQIAILGAGSVGSAVAFSLILNPVASEILLVDPNEEMRDAQVDDLSDASLSGVRVRVGSHKEAGQSSIVVITAGAKQRTGESRTDLLSRNLSILRSAIGDMKPFHKDTVILLVSNPVDVLTYFAQQLSGLPRRQVIGSGTFLDSRRLRGLLAREIDIDPDSIHASVIGEHGDTQLVTWSTVTIEGVPLVSTLITPKIDIDEDAVAAETRNKAAKIIKVKGATAYGIGSITASLCKSILFDEHKVRPVSHWDEGLKCCLSLPVVLGRKGIVRKLEVSISKKEKTLLDNSAETLRELIAMAAEEGLNDDET